MVSRLEERGGACPAQGRPWHIINLLLYPSSWTDRGMNTGCRDLAKPRGRPARASLSQGPVLSCAPRGGLWVADGGLRSPGWVPAALLSGPGSLGNLFNLCAPRFLHLCNGLFLASWSL